MGSIALIGDAQTQFEPADETSSAGLHPGIPLGAQYRCVVENDERAHSGMDVWRQPA